MLPDFLNPSLASTKVNAMTVAGAVVVVLVWLAGLGGLTDIPLAVQAAIGFILIAVFRAVGWWTAEDNPSPSAREAIARVPAPPDDPGH